MSLTEDRSKSAGDGAWCLTVACTREAAETLDDIVEALCAALDEPPAISFTELEEDNDDSWQMQAFFAGRPSPALVDSLLNNFSPIAKDRAKLEPVVEQDWVSLSQAGLKPISAGRFHVRNSADDPPVPGLVNFLIPASRAFGTGQHETTRGCLAMLDALRAGGHRFGNIADIGTGTGVLAFAALVLWPRACAIASDIDPASIDITRENMALNAVSEGPQAGRLTVLEAQGLSHPMLAASAPYDLIIANILAGPLIALAPGFAAHLADGGSLLLSGLLTAQAPAVLNACRREGLRLAAHRTDREWSILHLRRRPRIGWRRPERWSEENTVAPGYGSW